MGKNKGTKMSISEFMGDAPPPDMSLPTAPKQRDADDDGAFKRRTRRDQDTDYEPSRSEADSSWRRGGGGPPGGGGGGGFDDRRGGGGGGGFDDRRGGGGGGFDDRRGGGRFDDRRGGGFDDRRGGGGGGFDDRRSGGGGFDDHRGGGGFDDRRGGGGGGGGGGFDDRRGGGGGFSDRRSGGGGGFDDRRGGGGFEDRRSGGGFGERGGNDRFGGDRGDMDSTPSRGPPVGDRPRLNLVKRTAPVPPPKEKTSQMEATAAPNKVKVDPFGGAPAADTAAKLNKLDLKEKDTLVIGKTTNDANLATAEKSPTAADDVPVAEADVETKSDDKKEQEKKKLEPKVINSRAAALEGAPTPKRDSNNRDRTDRPSNRGPPPVVNKRFEALADEERDKNRERDDRRRDLGPPEPTNSRFAAAADADRSYRGSLASADDRGPPPVQNSRFAAMADSERSDERSLRPRGPPPIQNSRFAAAAVEAEREQMELEDRRRDNRDNYYNRDAGPPPIRNSRFADAIAADADYVSEDRRRGPPPVQNSRFAAAVAADDDYVPEDRRRGPPPQDRSDDRGGGRFDDRRGGGGGYDDRRGGGFDDRGGSDDRRGGYNDRRGAGSGYDDRNEDRRGEGNNPRNDDQGRNKVADLLKPKAPPVLDNILKPPEPNAAVHVDNMFKIPTKTKEEKEEEARKKEEEEKMARRAAKAEAEAAEAAANAIAHEGLLDEFVSGKILGDALKQWCEDKRAALPPVEKLIFHMLSEKELKNPDPECGWAEPSKYGAAFVSLVEDDIYNQMQVLWGIQKYCDKMGFPKLNEEYLIQSMFRAMYKFDLASDDAFAEWKDDESDEHAEGKLKAVIQTVDWFNWLQEDEDDDDAEEYEDE